jgi:hypothetical protein
MALERRCDEDEAFLATGMAAESRRNSTLLH